MMKKITEKAFEQLEKFIMNKYIPDWVRITFLFPIYMWNESTKICSVDECPLKDLDNKD